MCGPTRARQLHLLLALFSVVRCAVTAGFDMEQCFGPPLQPEGGCTLSTVWQCCPAVPPFPTLRQRKAADPLLLRRIASFQPLASQDEGLSTAAPPPLFQLPYPILVGLTVHRIFDINQRSQTFSMHYRLRIMWRDCRLLHNCSWMVVPSTHPLYSNFWKPDFKFEEQESVVDGMDKAGFTFAPDGQATFTLERVGSFRCAFDFTDVPFDKQRCDLTLLFPVGDVRTIRVWPLPGPKNESVIIENTANAEWRISPSSEWSAKSEVVWRELWSEYRQMSVVHMSFHIDRKPRSMIMNFVFPAVMYYLVSWLGLWIDPAAVPARAAIGVIPVLIMTNKLSGLTAAMPPISYSVRLENFLLSTLTFIVLQMLEFGFVNYSLRRRRTRKDPEPQRPGARPAALGADAEVENIVEVRPRPSQAGWEQARELGVRSLEVSQRSLQLPDLIALAVGDLMDTHFRWISILTYFVSSMIILLA